MLGSVTLDVAIGVALTFLLASLFLSALVEIIESFLKTRAADLEAAIGLMLKNDSGAIQNFYRHPLVFALFRGEYAASYKTRFFGRETGGNLPSYIPRDIFSAVLLDLESAGKAGDGAAQVMESYRRIYGGDVATLRTNVESWYDGVMDRAAGWYKRRTQKILFWLGLLIAVVFNINPIIISQHLSASPESRRQMVELATSWTEQEGKKPSAMESDKDKLQRLDQAVRSVGLPMGWNEFAISRTFPPGAFVLGSLAIATIGWAITAVATTLGAPFWFDVLNKLMVIRATVKPREKSPDEASEDRAAPGRRSEIALLTSGAPVGALAPAAAVAGSHDPAHGEHEDGCLEGYDLSDEEVTHDAELPPATGGIVGRN